MSVSKLSRSLVSFKGKLETQSTVELDHSFKYLPEWVAFGSVMELLNQTLLSLLTLYCFCAAGQNESTVGCSARPAASVQGGGGGAEWGTRGELLPHEELWRLSSQEESSWCVVAAKGGDFGLHHVTATSLPPPQMMTAQHMLALPLVFWVEKMWNMWGAPMVTSSLSLTTGFLQHRKKDFITWVLKFLFLSNLIFWYPVSRVSTV